MTIYYSFDAGTLSSSSHVLGTEDTARVPVFIQQVPEGFFYRTAETREKGITNELKEIMKLGTIAALILTPLDLSH